jgi:hypothetical protein
MPTLPATSSPTRRSAREQSLQEELIEEMFSTAEDIEESAAEEPIQDESSDDPPPPSDQKLVAAAETAAPDHFTTQRAELERRVTGSPRLPPALRDRLSQLASEAAWNESGEEQPALSVSQALAWLEQSLPRQFSLEADVLTASEHPAGDQFFHGPADPLDDQQAARLAAEQLAATGFAA